MHCYCVVVVDGPIRPIEADPDFVDPIPSTHNASRYDPEPHLRSVYDSIQSEHPWLFTTPGLHVHIVLGSLRVLYPINVLRNVGMLLTPYAARFASLSCLYSPHTISPNVCRFGS
jgi:hypothetical protein